MATKKSVKPKKKEPAKTAKPQAHDRRRMGDQSWQRMMMIGQGAINIAKKYGLIKPADAEPDKTESKKTSKKRKSKNA